MLKKKVLAAAHVDSFPVGATLLRELGGIEISGRGLNKTAVKIGTELVAAREVRTRAYFNQPLPKQHVEPTTPIALACVSIDGGRMQTRTQGRGPGVHAAHWRETKNALFLRMTSEHFARDPHPDLPACFADRQQMKTLLSGVGEGETEAALTEPARSQATLPTSPTLPTSQAEPSAAEDWRPRRLFRTCLSSLAGSDAFGRMMEVEADARGFYHAQKQAFVSDGLPYNWTIQQRHFHRFTPILDFVHAVERLYEAARSVHENADARWQDYLRWARWCWRGEVAQVLVELKARQGLLGLPPKDCEKTDPRKVLAEAIGYFENNAPRMKYPEYRRTGLPTTSALMESFVKELNARVKGTEKFWNDGASGEAILQLRAAVLCDDDRLSHHLSTRPGHPFHPNVSTPKPAEAAAA